ncbi:4'-phosphopantetheinyl transferase family protein [Christiangramia crocea]|uniref:4'-phosphopantetheinyl transferase superfamily protein n=1 Tax=Christiangramia crocea TaxID=2904124 RepID=A0A9X1UY80_9FLAO|nr:4'-phosphopantetheinyl transferase superfamily protein [Gramella crocea]MCG9972355.1 4'-phosphopantetheinyl transferase superfamily protein [Gramella crocea]
MIGNDIIDLKVSLPERKSENSRFMDKVFSKKERSFIENSEDGEMILWLMWSMKEAAYKAHQRNFGLSRALNPLSFSCALNLSERSATVLCDRHIYSIVSEVKSQYIHSYTCREAVFQKVFVKPGMNKEHLLEEIGAVVNLHGTALHIEKDSEGIPSLSFHNSTKKLPFSLSHHGNFTALAIPLINC